jgi:alpha-glucosidase (family GH31 glycosyl hydrolase)
MRGIQDDELYLRWLQYGVFSPINRLHSTNSEYMSKEPWKKSWAVNKISEEFLRLRHKLIPYIYTANYRTHKYGEPICMPMYYRYDCKEAYRVKNQYIFGGQLIVCPITRQADKRLNLAYADVWLPEGRWTDIFTGRAYKGGRMVRMYRDLDSIPVLAPEGAIVPMYKNGDTNSLSADQPLEINIWRGNGSYDLYEDDGESMEYKNGKFAITSFELSESKDKLCIIVTPKRSGNLNLPRREIHLKFRDIENDDVILTLADEPVRFEILNPIPRKNIDKEEYKNVILTRLQGSNPRKSRILKNKLPGYINAVLSESNFFY